MRWGKTGYSSPEGWLFVFSCSMLVANFLILWLWHLSSPSLDTFEAGEYLPIGQKIYQGIFFRSDAFSVANSANWKGLLQPVLIVPFLAVTGGEVLAASRAFLAGLFLLTAFMVWRILSEYLSRARATLGAAAFLGIPWVYQSAHNFNPELPTIALLLLIIYSAIRLRKQETDFHASLLGVYAGVGLCLRPFEIGACLVPVLVFLWPRLKFVSGRDWIFAAAALGLGLFLSILGVILGLEKQSFTYGIAASLFLAAYAILGRLWFRVSPMVLAFPLGIAISLPWWVVNGERLVYWIYSHTFTQTPEANRVPGDFFIYLAGLSGAIVGVYGGLLLLAFAIQIWKSGTLRADLSGSAGLVVLLSAVLATGFGAISLNDDYRYFVSIGTLVFLPVIGAAVAAGEKQVLRFCLVIGAILLSQAAAFGRIQPGDEPRGALDKIFSGSVWYNRGYSKSNTEGIESSAAWVDLVSRELGGNAPTLFMAVTSHIVPHLQILIQQLNYRMLAVGSEWSLNGPAGEECDRFLQAQQGREALILINAFRAAEESCANQILERINSDDPYFQAVRRKSFGFDQDLVLARLGNPGT